MVQFAHICVSMADGKAPDYDQESKSGDTTVKVICLGDSAVGKSKYVVVFCVRH